MSRTLFCGLDVFKAQVNSLLFLHCLFISVSTAQNTSLPTRLGFVQEPNGRGTVSLLWSCLFTWFICLWEVVHLNAASLTDSSKDWYLRKVGCMILGAIAPELIVTMAFTQWRNARHFVDGMNTLQRRSHLPMSPVSSTTEEAKDISNMIAQMRSLPINHWKMVHGFYCVMGGFVITNNEGKTFTINNQQLIWLLENGCVEVPDISVEGIKDKSKADSMIKAIAGLQATWFVGQGLGRWAQHLSTTTLEITTIAYVVSCVPALAFWWHKPVDVKVPTKLQVKRWSSEVTYAIRKLDPQTRQFMYMDRNEDEFPRAVNTVEIDASKGDRPDYFRGFLNWYPLVGVAMLYGLVHCIAWDFEFASAGEKWAWRVCAILTIYIAGMTAFKFSIWHIFTHSDRKERMVQSIEQVLATLYVCARVYLFIEVFLAFRSQPAGVYQSVNWSLYIPWEG